MLNDFCGKISVGLLLLASLWAPGCASSRSKADRDEMAAMRGQLNEMRNGFAALTTRMETLEGKINTLSATVAPADHVSSTNANASPVEPHPGEGSGVSPTDVPSARDPDGAFVDDDAVQDFRKAMIRFRAGQYPEAENAFSSFLEKYPDHPLAGNAAYLVGRCYFKQQNFKQAAEEYDRVLTTYDRSSHVAATLRDLADAEDELKLTDQAARHRQLLASLFPHSPESQEVREEMPPPTAAPANVPLPANKLDGPPPTAPGPSTAADFAAPPTAAITPAPAEHAVIQMQDVPPSAQPQQQANKAPTAPLDGVPAPSPKE